jgi:pimeloyl-ACP methyl ester carboxylesterase
VPSVEVTVDGRRLSVYDEGSTDGPAILYHHGTPLAGPPFHLWVESISARGARLIAYDRPGYGGSDPLHDRTITTAARDSSAIMDALGIGRFATWGISGGAPHALACGALLGDRVAAVASLAGPAPFDARGLNFFRGMGTDNIVEFGLAMAGREYLEPWAAEAAKGLAHASVTELTAMIATLVSPTDRPFCDGSVGKYWASAMPVTLAQGAAGWVDDDLAFVLPFGFEIEQIQTPTLIVHGHQDRFVPLEHGIWLADAIPAAEARLSEEEGHLSLYVNTVPAVHDWLLQHL